VQAPDLAIAARQVIMVGIAAETRFELQWDRMLKAAASCFNAKGFSGTSLKDVAKHLGLTDAALYYYVRNKEELVYQCYLRAAELGREAMERGIADGQTGFEQAFLYIRYHVEIFVGDRGPVAIMSEIPSLRPERDSESVAAAQCSLRRDSFIRYRRRQHCRMRCADDWKRHHGRHQLDSEVVSR
jgi:AcrR family transcriptional regulator